MKILLSALSLSVLLVTGSFSTVAAAPRDVSNRGRDYVVSSASLKWWDFGVSYDYFQRDLTLDPGGDITLKSGKAMAYVGYDLLAWLTPYITGGRSATTMKQGSFSDDGGGELQYGGGLQFNFLDHEVADPFLLEDRLRLNGNVEYTMTTASTTIHEMDWAEFDASLTLSIVNDISGNILFVPESIAVFAGPIYASLSSPDIKSSGSGKDSFGYTVGIEVFYTPSISFSAQVNEYDRPGYTVGLNVRF
jgi:opacity protein-like surface antigen